MEEFDGLGIEFIESKLAQNITVDFSNIILYRVFLERWIKYAYNYLREQRQPIAIKIASFAVKHPIIAIKDRKDPEFDGMKYDYLLYVQICLQLKKFDHEIKMSNYTNDRIKILFQKKTFLEEYIRLYLRAVGRHNYNDLSLAVTAEAKMDELSDELEKKA